MPTPNTGIPYIPENTTDPAAGLNLSLNVIDALLQTAAIDMGLTTPPGSPVDGDLHIVGVGATGPWTGQDNNLARYVAEGDFWQFYVAGVSVHVVLNKADGGLYAWNGTSWSPAVAGSGSGDVVGPESSVDLRIAVFDGTTGKLLADGGQTIAEVIAAASGGSVAWGALSGTLSDQADLQAALDAKAGKTLAVATPSNVSGTVTLDFASRSRYVGAITLAANVTTLAFSNLPGSGAYLEYELHIKQDATGGRAFAVPASHKALGGSDTAIASAANVVTVLTASSVDGGTTWRYAMQESA